MTLNTDIFLPVRLASQRLPSKHLKIINGQPILLKLIRRLEKSKKIRKIIVCTTTAKSDDPLVDLLEKESILYFRGNEKDIIKRFLDAANFFNTDYIIDVEGDKIYTDPIFVDKVADELEDPTIDFVIGNDSLEKFNEFNNFIPGFIPAGVKKSALEKLYKIKKTDDSETGYREFFTTMNIFNCKYIIPKEFRDNPNDTRLTLDYEEDLKLANQIFTNLGDNFSYTHVLDLFQKKPELHMITKPLIEKWKEHYKKNLTKFESKYQNT
jgi:spore coat polysaccharide biosynthesis protein SpsF|tara:strand:- start:3477 stop:4277 length:801 start_codon:yes stop_codon:yes gene_type:complete